MAHLQYGEELELDAALPSPPDGVLVHGLFTDGCRWDDDEMVIADSLHGVMNGVLPVMHMLPRMDFVPSDKDYKAPLYKTGVRAGVLSTTGECVREEK